MALVKDAIINLRLAGFNQVSAQAQQLGKQLGALGLITVQGAQMGAKGVQQQKGAVFSLQRAWRGLAANIQAAFVTLGTFTAAGVGIFKLAQRGDAFRGLERGFAATAGGAGQARQNLEALRVATAGSISDFDLMRASNQLTVAGIDVSNEKMAEAARATVVLGRAMGQDAAESFNRFALAAAKGSFELLDEIGLIVRAKEANEKFAAASGKTVEQMTAMERAQAFANEVLAQANTRMAALGINSEQVGTQTEQFGARWQNMVDRLALFVAQNPQIIEGLERIGISALRLAERLLPVVAQLGELVVQASDFFGLSAAVPPPATFRGLPEGRTRQPTAAGAVASAAGISEADLRAALRERDQALLAAAKTNVADTVALAGR